MNITAKDKVKESFLSSLIHSGLTRTTRKLYKSDLAHFTGWLILKVRSFGSYAENLSEVVPFISASTAREYINFLRQNNTPPATANRRLATIRRLSEFLVTSQVVDFDFMSGVENLSSPTASPLLDEFRKHLESEKVSKNTIKNYLADINQFMAWVEKV